MKRGRRILILLIILVLVGGMTVGERLWVRSWARPLKVAIYPIAMDPTVRAYVEQLQTRDFEDIGHFLVREAPRWGRSNLPAPRIVWMAPLSTPPPLPGVQSKLEAIQWSLRLRWYAFRSTPFWSSLGTVRLFVLYHPLQFDQALPHSHGLQKGMLGVVHVFASASQQTQNNFVIAHELLHTLGALDKYDASGQPIAPVGLADPNVRPLYPQYKTEIMGGRTAISAERSEMPKGLDDAVIGYATAAEIGW